MPFWTGNQKNFAAFFRSSNKSQTKPDELEMVKRVGPKWAGKSELAEMKP